MPAAETNTTKGLIVVARVNTSTLYPDFEDKSGLPKLEISRSGKNLIVQNVSHRQIVDLRAELKHVWRSRFEFLSEHPALLNLVTDQMLPDTSITQEAFVMMHMAFERLGRDGWLRTNIDTAANVMGPGQRSCNPPRAA